MEIASTTFYRTSTFFAEASVKDGKTILSDKFYTQPFKIMHPFYIKKNLMTVMQQSSSAGTLEGDTQEFKFVINEGARMELLSQSFEKLHKMKGGYAKRDTTISVAKDGLFKYSPLPTIPFVNSGFRSTITADLEDDSSQLVLLEILSGGRIAYNEEFVYNYYNSHIKVRKAGKLIYNDNAQFNPAETDMKGLGMYDGFTHMGTLLFFNVDKSKDLELLRGMIDNAPEVEGGATIIGSGDVSVKLLGTSAQDLWDLAESMMNAVL